VTYASFMKLTIFIAPGSFLMYSKSLDNFGTKAIALRIIFNIIKIYWDRSLPLIEIASRLLFGSQTGCRQAPYQLSTQNEDRLDE